MPSTRTRRSSRMSHRLPSGWVGSLLVCPAKQVPIVDVQNDADIHGEVEFERAELSDSTGSSPRFLGAGPCDLHRRRSNAA